VKNNQNLSFKGVVTLAKFHRQKR